MGEGMKTQKNHTLFILTAPNNHNYLLGASNH